jgi:hypothetical protein
VLQPIEQVGSGVCAYSLGNLNGPPLLLRSAPSKLLGVLEVELSAADPGTARAAGSKPVLRAYRLHWFVQVRHRPGVRLVPLGDAEPRLRHRLERRLATLFPDLQGRPRG